MKRKNIIVTDQQADESIKSLKTGNIVTAEEFFQCSLFSRTKDNTSSPDNGSSIGDVFSAAEIRFLKAVIEYPMRSTTEYIKLAHISPNTLSKIRADMVKRGFIREHKLERTGGCGRGRTVLEPLDTAKQAVTNMHK